MDVFDLRDRLIAEYREFATSFTAIYARDLKEQIERIYDEAHYRPEPLIQINPNFKGTRSVADLVAEGALDPRCAQIFTTIPSREHPKGEPLALWKHQEQAIALAAEGDSFVVTTGSRSE